MTTARVRAEQAGAAVAEAVLLAPALLTVLLVVVYAGQLSHVEAQVRSAASASARAASLAQTAPAAQAAAAATAADDLAQAGVVCTDRQVTADVSGLGPGGQVTAEVACTMSLGELTGLGLPGARTVTASSTMPVDTYRGGGG